MLTINAILNINLLDNNIAKLQLKIKVKLLTIQNSATYLTFGYCYNQS